ncbi:class I SAM-dependent methyltransferase [Taibaiella lutea]|uniref:Class I SAM-dependent methyltransferase n=1 Tax=Taibaiella lutea TaxID=2608001 RepID=A0A5M6CK21_9BACT|nr:class I SAM-dependent methyltransferase [Taibaiella lutea]KAA5533695.1 class I SAM-dependent methyltransferase [Taibaiella lutea]
MDQSAHAASVFNELANKYQDRFMHFELYNDTFDLFCDNIPKPNAEILELACGPGNITKYLLSKRPDFNILGTDLAPNMIELAKANNPSAIFQIMDCRAVSTIDKKYDSVMIGFCLPYLDKEETEKLIADTSKILNEGGIVYLSTMEAPYSKSGPEKSSAGHEIYMHYYMADDLVVMLESNDFEIISLQRKDFLQNDGSTTKDIILIAKRSY